jgi:diguanylate cyclase (GGDEF)-like protein
VGRYGGEEFLVILPGSDADQAIEVLDRIRRDFSLIRFAYEDTWFETTFSAGVSQFFPLSHAESMIKEADEALYDAKNSGRNCVVTRG